MSLFNTLFGGGQPMSVQEALANAPVTHYGTENFMRGHGQHKPHLWFSGGLWHSYYCGSHSASMSKVIAYQHSCQNLSNAKQ